MRAAVGGVRRTGGDQYLVIFIVPGEVELLALLVEVHLDVCCMRIVGCIRRGWVGSRRVDLLQGIRAEAGGGAEPGSALVRRQINEMVVSAVARKRMRPMSAGVDCVALDGDI